MNNQGLSNLSLFQDIRFRENPVNHVEKTVMCEKHGEYKALFSVYSDNSHYQETFCKECEKENEENEKLKAEKQERENNIKLCKSCNIEPEYFDKTLNDFNAESESQKKALNAVNKMFAGEINKVILLGDNGLGKTMLGSIAAKHYKGKIYSMYEITTMIRQSYTVKAEKSELEIVNELASVPFLAIDELGRTNGSVAELNWLSYILDKRHTRKLPFMILSNTHLSCNCPNGGCPKCFENTLDADILSRLRQNSLVVVLKGNDFRKLK